MNDLLIEALRYGGALGILALLPACLYASYRGEDIRIALVERSERRREEKRQRLTRRLIEGGWVTRRAERALHNDYDDRCVHWYGDRNPAKADQRNREFGGAPTSIMTRRCTVCAPFPMDEEDVYLGYSEPTGELALRDSVDAYIRDARHDREQVIEMEARR